jgi:hypothetical protein
MAEPGKSAVNHGSPASSEHSLAHCGQCGNQLLSAVFCRICRSAFCSNDCFLLHHCQPQKAQSVPKVPSPQP